MIDSEEVKRKLKAAALIREMFGRKPSHAQFLDVIKDIKAMVEHCKKNFPTEYEQIFGENK